MTDHIIKSWNAQADHMNQWPTLGEDEKIAWAYQQGMERAAEICEAQIASGQLAALEAHRASFIADAIRAHAKNQPESTHDTGNV